MDSRKRKQEPLAEVQGWLVEEAVTIIGHLDQMQTEKSLMVLKACAAFRMKAERKGGWNCVPHFSCETKAPGWPVQRSWLAAHSPERNERASHLIPSHLNPVCHVSDLPVEMAK